MHKLLESRVVLREALKVACGSLVTASVRGAVVNLHLDMLFGTYVGAQSFMAAMFISLQNHKRSSISITVQLLID